MNEVRVANVIGYGGSIEEGFFAVVQVPDVEAVPGTAPTLDMDALIVDLMAEDSDAVTFRVRVLSLTMFSCAQPDALFTDVLNVTPEADPEPNDPDQYSFAIVSQMRFFVHTKISTVTVTRPVLDVTVAGDWVNRWPIRYCV